MDRGAQRATVHRVANSSTRLKRLREHSPFPMRKNQWKQGGMSEELPTGTKETSNPLDVQMKGSKPIYTAQRRGRSSGQEKDLGSLLFRLIIGNRGLRFPPGVFFRTKGTILKSKKTARKLHSPH